MVIGFFHHPFPAELLASRSSAAISFSLSTVLPITFRKGPGCFLTSVGRAMICSPLAKPR
jgi:hypothetical protein